MHTVKKERTEIYSHLDAIGKHNFLLNTPVVPHYWKIEIMQKNGQSLSTLMSHRIHIHTTHVVSLIKIGYTNKNLDLQL